MEGMVIYMADSGTGLSLISTMLVNILAQFVHQVVSCVTDTVVHGLLCACCGVVQQVLVVVESVTVDCDGVSCAITDDSDLVVECDETDFDIGTGLL